LPSLPITPLALLVAMQPITIEPARFGYSSAQLTVAGGDLLLGPSLVTNITIKKPRLDRLIRGVGYYDNKGVATIQQQALWQKNVESVEGAFGKLIEQVDAIQAALNASLVAQAAAVEATQKADTAAYEIDIANSRTDPVDGLISADDLGNLTIASHGRVYSQSTVGVNSGSLSGFAAGQFVRVYYRDPARTGGNVMFEATIDDITQTGDVHIVGGVQIPNAGSPPSNGVGATPPGYVRALEGVLQ